MDGCEVYNRLKKIKPEIKNIIFSRCIDQYSMDELSKRNFKELSEKIEKVLEQP